MADSHPASRTLVLIHAFPLGAHMWAPQLAAFGGWRIVTPALPGFDGSAPFTSSMEGFAGHVNTELDHLGIERAVICGLSLGGYVTFGVLRQRPKRASAVILAGTRCGADTDEGRASRVRMLRILEEKGPLGVFEEMRPKLFGPTTRAERPGVVEEAKEMAEAQSPAGIAGAIRAMRDRPDSMPMLSTIRVPTLILVGEEDEDRFRPLSRCGCTKPSPNPRWSASRAPATCATSKIQPRSTRRSTRS